MRDAWGILDIFHIGIFQPILQDWQDKDWPSSAELPTR